MARKDVFLTKFEIALVTHSFLAENVAMSLVNFMKEQHNFAHVKIQIYFTYTKCLSDI